MRLKMAVFPFTKVTLETEPKLSKLPEIKIPNPLLTLAEFQEEGVRFITARNRSLLADEPGLGKTPQALVSLSLWLPQRILIIAPAVAVGHWENEIHDWYSIPTNVSTPIITPIYASKQLNKLKQKDAVLPHILIMSYKVATSNAKFLAYTFLQQSSPRYPTCIVIDEAHYLKSWTSQRTRVILREVWPRANKGILLTGTPVTHSIMDLHPLYAACQGTKVWGSQKDFGAKYSNEVYCPFKYDHVKYEGINDAALPELKRRAKEFVLRRKKKDVAQQLPKKRFFKVYLDDGKDRRAKKLTAKQKQALLEGLTKNLPPLDISADGVLGEQVSARLAVGKLPTGPVVAQVRKQIGLEKLPLVLAWLDDFIVAQEGKQFLLFAHHTDVIAELASYLASKDVTHRIITGSTSVPSRQAYVKEFQAVKTSQGVRGVQCMLMNIQAGGISIKLTNAATAVFAELDWSAMNMLQAIDRMHRHGQEAKHVDIYFLLLNKSIDIRVVEVIRSKNETQKTLLTPGD